MVSVFDPGQCHINCSMFHAAHFVGMISECKNNSVDGPALGFVNSHGEGKIKGERLKHLNLGNRGEQISSGEVKRVPAGALRSRCCDGQNDVTRPTIKTKLAAQNSQLIN